MFNQRKNLVTGVSPGMKKAVVKLWNGNFGYGKKEVIWTHEKRMNIGYFNPEFKDYVDRNLLREYVGSTEFEL